MIKRRNDVQHSYFLQVPYLFLTMIRLLYYDMPNNPSRAVQHKSLATPYSSDWRKLGSLGKHTNNGKIRYLVCSNSCEEAKCQPPNAEGVHTASYQFWPFIYYSLCNRHAYAHQSYKVFVYDQSTYYHIIVVINLSHRDQYYRGRISIIINRCIPRQIVHSIHVF